MTNPDDTLVLDAYLTDTITWTQDRGADEWGTPKAPAVVSVRARVKHSSRLIRDYRGEEVASSAEVLMFSKPAYGDKLRIDGVDRPVAAVQEIKSWGVSHYKVYTS